ncbi:MAG: protein kinase [Planctomycetes bacterium]|nr:protein kinase [Planctomycetota bacterium]
MGSRSSRDLRAGTTLGKYRLMRSLGRGGFATVYRATDLVEGVTVALKVPHAHLLDADVEASLGQELKIIAGLEHPNVLTPKNAMVIDGRLVIAYPLGQETLADRMTRRMSRGRVIDFARQMLAGLAYAHDHRIIHCDIKPENFVLFGEDNIRLTDFGISKTARRTVHASGSGTVGYMAPEQAMGRPSFHSDVFSMGLVIYRMFSGELPTWPFDHPLPRESRIRQLHGSPMAAFFHHAISVEPRQRIANGRAMESAFEAAYDGNKSQSSTPTGADWRDLRSRQFFQAFGSQFSDRSDCRSCGQTVGATMQKCPWCGDDVKPAQVKSYSKSCERCGRGLKSDWRFCPWCWGPSVAEASTRRWTDARYVARCGHEKCREKVLMPFMKYCPRCHAKVDKIWKLAGSRATCDGCGHGVAKAFWRYCAWCGRSVEPR